MSSLTCVYSRKVMESSVLNIAHEKQRRAEAFLRDGRFEEAADCHEAVANLLLEVQLQLQASNNASNSSVINKNLIHSKSPIPRMITLESIALQRDHHKRQAQIIRMKQARYEEYKAKVDSHKQETLTKQASKSFDQLCETNGSFDKTEGSLNQAIHKILEKQDNILSLISLPDDEDKTFKHPKDTNTVIEELRTVNSQLRSLIGSLLNQLEAKDQEIKRLKEQLISSSEIVPNVETPLDSIHSVQLEPLPPLAPLEMPRFDFNTS